MSNNWLRVINAVKLFEDITEYENLNLEIYEKKFQSTSLLSRTRLAYHILFFFCCCLSFTYIFQENLGF